MNEENERTIISIVDENDDKSTITLDKWTSDILHSHFNDVHKWVQKLYNSVCVYNEKNSLKLSRRERGNLVRKLSNKKALDLNPIEITFEDLKFD